MRLRCPVCGDITACARCGEPIAAEDLEHDTAAIYRARIIQLTATVDRLLVDARLLGEVVRGYQAGIGHGRLPDGTRGYIDAIIEAMRRQNISPSEPYRGARGGRREAPDSTIPGWLPSQADVDRHKLARMAALRSGLVRISGSQDSVYAEPDTLRTRPRHRAAQALWRAAVALWRGVRNGR